MLHCSALLLQNTLAFRWLRPLPQIAKQSIPEATHRKPAILTVVAPGDIAIAPAQKAVQDECCIILRRTPPVAVGGNIVEETIVETGASWQTCETAAVRSPGVRCCPMGSSDFFYSTAC